MEKKEAFIYKDERYILLLKEKEYIFNPEIFGLAPIWKQTAQYEYAGTYEVKDYKLRLQDFVIHSDSSYPVIQNIEPVPVNHTEEKTYVSYQGLFYPIFYTGAVVIGRDFIESYGYTEDFPCFCYGHVVELIFENGNLITTIEHDKAMVRIRKNIEKGLRDLNKGKDARCIQTFMKSSFVGKYRDSMLKRGWKLTRSNIKKIFEGTGNNKLEKGNKA